MSRASRRAQRGHGDVPSRWLALALIAGFAAVACTAGQPSAGPGGTPAPTSGPAPVDASLELTRQPETQR